MHVWQWIRHLMPRWDYLLRPLAIFGGYWVLPGSHVPSDPPEQRGQPGWPEAAEPPPGHPERLVKGQPLSPAERQLWVALDGIDW